MKNPITRQKYRIFIYISLWFCISLLQYLLSSGNFPDTKSELFWATIIQNSVLGTLFLFSWYGLRYINLETQGRLPVLLNHLAYMVVILTIWFFLSKMTDSWILRSIKTEYNLFISPVKLLIGIFSYLLFISFIYFDGYYNSYLDKLRAEQQLFETAKEAELKMLKSQMNPHFIFNSLNSISALTLSNPEKAHDMIIRLSDFLRYTVKSGSTEWVHLKEEVENLKAYLEIEKIRFGDKIIIHFDIDEECDDWLVPSMILQPLIENALKHGVYQSLGKEYITMETRLENGNLLIMVKNSFPESDQKSKGTQTGLKNIRKRLNLIYERRANLLIEKIENSFRVTLILPETK